MSKHNDQKPVGIAPDSRLTPIMSDQRPILARQKGLRFRVASGRTAEQRVRSVSAVLSKTLIVLLCMSVPTLGLASWRYPRFPDSRRITHPEATVASSYGEVESRLLEKAFRDGATRSLTVFDSDGRGIITATAPVDLRQEGEEGEDESTCVAEATKQSEEAIQRICETASAEECEIARRTNTALLRAELLKCREEYAISETDSATSGQRHNTERRSRLGDRAKTKLVLSLIVGFSLLGYLTYTTGRDEFGWFGGNEPTE